MALGFFRGSFDVDAANAVLSSPYAAEEDASAPRSGRGATTATAMTSSISSFFPEDAYANRRQLSSRSRDDDVASVKSLGSELLNLDGYGFDNDGAMTSDSYDLLDLESAEEVRARDVRMPSAKAALEQLHQWSLVEFDSKTNRYRMHNLVQLFAEAEATSMGELAAADETNGSTMSSFVAAAAPLESPAPPVKLGKELMLTWKRRFVRHYCIVVARASHAYRFDGTLAVFDKERPNIESAMRLAHELTTQSIEQVREANRQAQQAFEFAESSAPSRPHLGRSASGSGGGSGKSFRNLSSSSSLSSSGSSSSRRLARDSSIVDALLYSNLVVRARFIFRARVEPRRRVQVLSACLQLLRETRVLSCTCGNSENDASRLLWEDAKYDRDLARLDELPSFETPAPAPTLPPEADRCSCIGVRELIALEALLLTDLGYASCDVTDWIAGEYHYLEALRLQRDVLGWEEHPQVAEVLNQLGICLSTRWGYLAYNVWLLQHAERLLRGSLEMRKRVLGDKHPEYATSLNNLANFYKNCNPNGGHTGGHNHNRSDSSNYNKGHNNRDNWQNGKKNTGSQHRRRRDSDHTSSTGSDSARTGGDDNESVKSAASSNSNSAATPDADAGSEQPDIEGMYRESLKIREANLGKNHPQVAQSLNNLALFLSGLETKNLRYARGL